MDESFISTHSIEYAKFPEIVVPNDRKRKRSLNIRARTVKASQRTIKTE